MKIDPTYFEAQWRKNFKIGMGKDTGILRSCSIFIVIIMLSMNLMPFVEYSGTATGEDGIPEEPFIDVLNSEKTITAEPDIQVTPSGFDISIEQGTDTEVDLIIRNEGLANLDFTIFHGSGYENWSKGTDLPERRGQGAAVCGPDGMIYFMGGYTGTYQSTVFMLDPATGDWVQKSSMPGEKRGHRAVLGTDDMIYVTGGVPENEEVYAYDVHTDNWTTLANDPDGTWESSATLGNDGKIYVFGGKYSKTTTRVYDPESNTWEIKKPLPSGRFQAQAVTADDGKIFVMGGREYNGDTPSGTVQVYDPAADTWSTGPDMPTPRSQFLAIKSPDGSIYTIGGGRSSTNNEGPFYDVVEIFNPSNNTWYSFSPALPTARKSLTGAMDDHGNIYAIGGGNGNYLKTVEILTFGGFYRGVTVSPGNGSLSPSNQTTIHIGINASGLEPGIRRTNLTIFSNDPEADIFLIPINLTVLVPAHDIAVNSLDVPSTCEAGKPLTINATILNQGIHNETNITIKLKVDGSEKENRTISRLDSGDATGITLNWTPPLAGNYLFEIVALPVTGENLTANNDRNTTVSASAEPDIRIDPLGFNTSLDQGTTTVMNLTIGNDGLADLEFEIKNPWRNFDPSDEGVLLTGDDRVEPELLEQIRDLGYSLTYQADFPTDISGYEVIMLVGNDADYPEETIDSFVENGGGLIIIENAVHNDRFLPSAKSNPVSSHTGDWTKRLGATVVNSDSPITMNMESTSNAEGFSEMVTLKPGAEAVIKWNDDEVFAATYEYGSGRIVYLNDLWIWYGSDAPWAGCGGGPQAWGPTLMKNSLGWVRGNEVEDEEWVLTSVLNGTIEPWNETKVSITLNASHLDPGFYRTNLTISSNDPDREKIIVPVNMTVNPVDHEIRVTNISAPENAEAGMNITVQATIFNQGLTNESNITIQLRADGDPVANTTISRLDRGNETTVHLIWAPPIAGNYSLEVYAVPVSQESIIYNNFKNTTISVTAEPNIRVDPSGFNISIDQGTVTETNLTIDNQGLADLVYSAFPDQNPHALEFDGIDDYVKTDGVFSHSGASITFQAWVYPHTTSSEMTIMSLHEDGDYGFEPNLDSNGNIWFRSSPDGSTWYDTNTNIKYSANTWMHLAYVITSANRFLYRNGSLIYSDSNGGLNCPANKQLTIGMRAYQNRNDRKFDGVIDEVRVIQRALTEEEVMEDFTSSGGYPSRPETLGWWRFDENSSSTVHDSSGNDNNGTVNSASWTKAIEPAFVNIEWLSLSPSSGVIRPAKNEQLKIGFDASHLDPGLHDTHIIIRSNDPEDNEIRIPVSLTVNPVDHEIKVVNISVPTICEAGVNITINTTILNQGLTNETNVRVQLNVDGEKWDNRTIPSLNIGNSTEISFTWKALIAGDYLVEILVVPVSGENIMFNNEKNITLNVTADPKIWVIPIEYNITVHTGEMAYSNLTIGNDGPGFLEFATNTDHLVSNINVGLPAGNNLERDPLEADLVDMGFHVFQISSINDAISNSCQVIIDFPGTNGFSDGAINLNTWVSNGNGYIQLSDHGRDLISNSYDSVGAGRSVTVTKVDPDHPIVRNMPSTYSSYGFLHNRNYGYVGWATSPTAIDIMGLEAAGYGYHSKGVAVDTLGDGNLVYIGYEPFGKDATANDLRLLTNAVVFAASGQTATESWLTGTPQEGVVQPFDQANISLILNATGLGPGFYQTNISIASNDPLHDVMVIPINLTVIKQEHDLEVIDIEAPWYVTTQDGAEIETIIRNNGLNNETNVVVNLTVDGNTDLSIIVPYIQSGGHRLETLHNASENSGDVGLFRGDGTILLEETFPASSLDSAKWPVSSTSGMSSSIYHSSPYGCDLDSSEYIESKNYDISKFTAGYISFYYRRSGIDNAEYLRLYYSTGSSSWMEIWNVMGGSSDGSFTFTNVSLPETAFEKDFRFKFQLTGGGSSSDDIFLDDITMGARRRQDTTHEVRPLFADPFITSSLDTAKWPDSTYSGISSSIYNSAPYSCNLDSSEHLDSMVIDLSDHSEAQVKFYFRLSGIDSDEYLKLYYYSSSHNWLEIWNVRGGTSDSSFRPASVDLPVGAFHENFQFRLIITGGASTIDDVYIDDVEVVTRELVQDAFVVSEPIKLPAGFSWDSVNIVKEEGYESHVFVSVLYGNGTGIPGLENLAGTTIDLTGNSALAGETILRLRAVFLTTGSDSYLRDWNVRFTNFSDANDTEFWWDSFSNEMIVSFQWQPADEGWKDVAIQVEPVAGEKVISNNRDNETLWCFRSGGSVLVDYGHDSYAASGSPGNYDTFQHELVLAGYVVGTTWNPISREVLGQYDVFLSISTGLDYSVEERTAIREFVAGGGGFMLIGGRNAYQDYDLLTNYANITWQSPGGSSGVTQRIEDHEITEGVSSLFCSGNSNSFLVSDQAVAIVRDAGSNKLIQVAASEYGNGRIIALADEYWFSNNKIESYDNLRFGLNMMKWFTNRNVVTVNETREYVKLVGAGEYLELEINITNEYTWNDTFDLTMAGTIPDGWSTTFGNCSVYLPAGESTIVILQVQVPSELPFSDNASITIMVALENSSRYDDARIDLVIPPLVRTIPPSISIEAPIDKVKDHITTITMENIGDGDLQWDLSYNWTGTSGVPITPVNIVAWTGYTNIGGEFFKTMAAIDMYFTDYILTETMTSNIDTLRSILEGQDVFLLPEQAYVTGDELVLLGERFSGVLRDFVEDGGTIISCGALDDDQNAGFLNATGLVELHYAGYSTMGDAVVEVKDHPITRGLASTIEIESNFNYCNSTTDMAVLVSYDSYPAVLAQTIGKGHIVYIPYDYQTINEDAARLMANAVQWSSNDPIMKFTQDMGFLNATDGRDAEMNISLDFEVPENILPGIYYGNITIWSNDPLRSQLVIPVNLTLVPSERDLRIDDLDAPWYATTQDGADIVAKVANYGENDEIDVKVNLTLDGDTVQTAFIPYLQASMHKIETNQNANLYDGSVGVSGEQSVIIFEDSFPAPSLDTTKWPISSYSGIISTSHSAPYSCNLDSSEHLDSKSMDLSEYYSGNLSFYYYRTGLDGGEYLRLAYYSASSGWIELWNVEGGQGDPSFMFTNVELPGSAFHPDFKFKLELTGGGGTSDDVLIDDVELRVNRSEERYIISEAISRSPGFSWESLNLTKEEGSGSEVYVSVLDGNGTVISGLENMSGTDVDLSGVTALDGEVVIRLRAYFIASGNNSLLHDWTVVSVNSTDDADSHFWVDTFSNNAVISFHWTPNETGWHNVSVLAGRVPGENFIRNNEEHTRVWCFELRGSVLMDHGHVSYSSIGYNDDFVAELFRAGFIVDTTMDTITHELLENHTTFLSMGTSSDYTEEERIAIREFIADGGGFLLMGGRNSYSDYSLLTDYANITWTGSSGGEGITDNIEPHAITTNISSLYCKNPTDSLVVSDNAVACVYDTFGGSIQVAASEYGNGRVVALLDEYWFDTTRLIREDNLQFGLNIIDWLTHRNVISINETRDYVGYFQTGDEVTINVTLFNDYPRDDTFTLTLSGELPDGWTVQLEKASFYLAAGEQIVVPVEIKVPTEPDTNFSVAMMLEVWMDNNSRYDNMSLELTIPPVITVRPDSLDLEVSIDELRNLTATITLENSGDADLEWEISVEGSGEGNTTPGDIRILAWLAYADIANEYANTITAINRYFTDYTLTESATTNPAQLQTALEGQQVFLIPEQEDSSDLRSLGADFADVLDEFVRNGGLIVSCGATDFRNTGLLDGSGLVELEYHGSQNSGASTVVATDHPVMKDLGTTMEHENAVFICREATDMEVLAQYGSYPSVLVKDIGKGHIVYTPYDFYSINDDGARLIANAVQWVAQGFEMNMTLSPQNGTLKATAEPSSSVNITLEVEVPENIRIGTYCTNITIHSNDPLKPTIQVPLVVTILLPEHDTEITDMKAPWYVTNQDGAPIEATLRNNGLNDETDIMVNLTVDGDTAQSVVIPYLQSRTHRLDTLHNSSVSEGKAGLSLGNEIIQFEDSFPSPSLDSGKWPGSSFSGMSSSVYNTAPYGCDLDGPDHLDSTTMDISDYSIGYISFYYRRSGIDNGEYLRLTYQSESSGWVGIWNVNGGTTDSSFFFVNLSLPDDAYHSDFRFKLQISPSGSSSDDVYIDDVKVVTREPKETGYIVSEAINLPDGFTWNSLNLTKEEGDGSHVYVSVLYGNGTVVPGLENLSGTDIDLADIGSLTGETTIRLRANFVGADIDPHLLDWCVFFTNSSTVNESGYWKDMFSNEVAISFHWIPSGNGWKNVAIEVSPVQGERLLSNNRVNGTLWSFLSRGKVLVDYGHDSYASYGSPSYYDEFLREVFQARYEVDNTTEPITREMLEKYNAFFSIGTGQDYSTEERTAIREFVADGGGFMVLGGRNALGDYNLLTDYANITWQTPGGGSGVTMMIYDHDILEGISSLYCTDAGDSLVVSDQAVACVYENGDNYIQVAASEYGKGKVVALQDEYWFSNDRLYLEDNLMFGINILRWLTQGISLSVDKDSIMLNATESTEVRLTVQNQMDGGMINLTLTGLELGWNGTFDNSSFMLMGGEVRIVNLTITAPSNLSHPDTITAVISAGLNDWEFSQTIEIFVQMPSKCTLPDSVHVKMEPNMTQETTISIHNIGDGDLDWSIELPGGEGQEDVHILAWTAYADIDQEYENTITAIDQYFTDYTLEETTTTNANILRNDLEGRNVFLIPWQEGGVDLRTIGEAFADVLEEFVTDGGTIVSCAGYSSDKNIAFLDGTGLVDLQYQGYVSSGTGTVEIADHPVTEGLGGSVVFAPHVMYCQIATDMDVLVRQGSYPAVLAADIGKGHVV